MDRKPSTNEPGGSCMELHKSRDLIIALKKAKAELEYTLPRIEEEIRKRGKSVSLSTLKRVFKEGSEDESAASFSFEHTLLPIAEVLLDAEEIPTPEGSPYSLEIELLKADLRVQEERVESLLARNKILEDRVTFMQTQIERKDRRIDEREDIIRKVMAERDLLRERLEAFGTLGVLK